MEDIYRQHIIKNVEKLIRLTNYDKLMNGCIHSELLSCVMRNNIENFDHGELSAEQYKHEQHKRLFIKLTKRGPRAYQNLKKLLMTLECDEAVRLLNQPGCSNDSEFHSLHQRVNKVEEPEMRNNSENNQQSEQDGGFASKNKLPTSQPQLEVYTNPIKGKYQVKKSQFINTDSKVGTYPMYKHNRGVFFMVNIIDFPNKEERRNGAEEDGESLLHLFKELGFILFAYVNLTQSEFFVLLDDIIKSEYTLKAQCFVMTLMTHGNVDDNSAERVQFHDGSIIKVRDIEDRFENRLCPNLVNKPKILIFPFCRGDIVDYGQLDRRGVQTDGIPESQPRIKNTNIPTLSDIFICHASIPRFRTHRDPIDGSWYIQKFCKIMAEHAHDTDFEDIVKLIQHETGQMRTSGGGMQTGSYVNNGFNKKLYFNPGVFEEN